MASLLTLAARRAPLRLGRAVTSVSSQIRNISSTPLDRMFVSSYNSALFASTTIGTMTLDKNKNTNQTSPVR